VITRLKLQSLKFLFYGSGFIGQGAKARRRMLDSDFVDLGVVTLLLDSDVIRIKRKFN